MANASHRYRITVTPVENNGLQCQGRCTIEFEHSCHDDWMGILEAMQPQRGLTGDERAALIVGTMLLRGLMLDHRKDADDLFAPLRPHMGDFIKGLKQRNQATWPSPEIKERGYTGCNSRICARMKARTSTDARNLLQIPNIGPAMVADFQLLGITSPAQLTGSDPFKLYRRLCRITGIRHDPCVLDTFISAVRFMEGAPPLPWWHYTEERKSRYPGL